MATRPTKQRPRRATDLKDLPSESAAAASAAAGVSSPAATGGAGTFFEQHVGAYWLAQLLVKGVPPVLLDCSVVELQLQTEGLGWHTDDFLVIGETGAGRARKLAGQVKRSFTVSAADDECKKTFHDFWRDFKSPDRFSAAADRLVLVTSRGSNTLLEHLVGLLDTARAACDGADFERRLRTKGFVSAKMVSYAEAIRSIVAELDPGVSVADLWPFLRVLHVLSLDLGTSTGQTEASVKTLLAHTATGADPVGAAQDTWNTLLREIGEGMPAARRFRRDGLPEATRRHHSPVPGHDQRALGALRQHSSLILKGIRSSLGSNFHLGRAKLVQQVLERSEAARVVLVSGAAGSGKSNVAKDAVQLLAADHFAFAFRAEEFATPHFDETLSRAQIPASASALGATLAAHGRKVLLVESVERLLEASTRDAFRDLLTLVAQDPTWRMVLTCRDYSADLVQTAFLVGAGLACSAVPIPPLDDLELGEVEGVYPQLARPLADITLRRLLRNPYVLDKATQVPWQDQERLPTSAWEFRRWVWQAIVRAEHHAAGGMPQRRENTFVEVALRRARTLALYAACGDLDSEVLDRLRGDSLLVASDGPGALAAPAHDVLEDWAILHWIEAQHATTDGAVRALASVLGTYPAVRRTYRTWVAEIVERDPAAADRLFRSVIRDLELPAQFRDDTIISILRSAAAATFLQTHSADLIADDNRLLRLVIRLLRVACVTSPTWLEGLALPSVLAVPEGPAWACVLRFVRGSLGPSMKRERGLLLGFIDDWARGVGWQHPYPDGADAAAAIAHWLLAGFGDYRAADERKRTLRVIAKIPNADRAAFLALIQDPSEGAERDPVDEELREILFEGLEGMPAARDLPDETIAAAKSYLLCTAVEDRHHSEHELETLFGFQNGGRYDFFPASAYRGPFLPLVRFHPRKALAFMTSVFNHSADWYAHPRVWSRSVEPPSKLRLTFADGTSKVQWCNGRLWCLYRGMSVGPYILQCLLMALEAGLLEFAEAAPQELDELLTHLLRQNDSAAVTAVVASVAAAFPRRCGETLLVLLSSPACVLLDLHRCAHERHAPSKVNGLFPSREPTNKIYEQERAKADARPHRRKDLQFVILELQFGPLAPRVQALLDQHRASLAPLDQQGEEDRVWRLALHRMDARLYRASHAGAEGPDVDGGDAAANGAPYVRLDLSVPDPDLKAMADEAGAHLADMNARSSLLMWGCKVFDHEAGGYDPGEWRTRLREAAAAIERDPTEGDFDWGRGGPAYVAAVCVRDHWDEMSADEKEWCADRVCSEVSRSDVWDPVRMQRGAMSADRPCAFVIPILLGRATAGPLRVRAERALVLALTHAVEEVRTFAATGIGMHLWGTDRVLPLRCVRALAKEATLVQKDHDAEVRRSLKRPRALPTAAEPWDAPPSYTGRPLRSVDEIQERAATQVRKEFQKKRSFAKDADKPFDPTSHFGATANVRVLTILAGAPTEAVAIAAYAQLARTLVAWWDTDEDRRRSHRGRERDFRTELAQAAQLHRFLLLTPLEPAKAILQPILDAAERHPKEVGAILNGLIGVEDSSPNTAQFWALWALFADKVRGATWLSRIDREYASGTELLSAAFLESWWKNEVRHWRSLEGYAQHVHDFFSALPASSVVLEKYLRLLFHVGEQSLPEAFIGLATWLSRGNPVALLERGSSSYYLEVLLQRHVYARPLELKRRKELREAILFLLDRLVEANSSSAFRMRDDFVTPLAAS